tara:strand:+ start:4405 stop:4746 length:342 start_codon:yes stop_codon:yes gene_type:complete
MNRKEFEKSAAFQHMDRVVDRILSSDLLTISVHDGEEWAIKQSRDKADIMANLAATDMETLRVRVKVYTEKQPAVAGNFYLVWDGPDADPINDHTDNAFCHNVVTLVPFPEHA